MSNSSTIDNKTNLEQATNNNFFSKRNVIIIVTALLLSIALIVITIIFILKINWQTLFEQFGLGFQNSNGWLWFLLLLLFIPWSCFARAFTITVKLKKLGYKIKLWDQIMYATTCVFLVAVTPANFVSDPYTIYWVKSHGVSTSKASALTACNALLWEIAQLIITMPSLIWMCVRWQDIFGNNAYDSAAGRLVFIFMFIGITVDFVGLAVMLIVGFNRKLHYSLSRLFNRVKKFLHLSYHTKEQTYQTYVVEAKLQREFILLLKMWKSSIAILIVVFFTEVYLYVAVFLSVRFIANATYTLSFWEIFNVANVTTTANRFVPLPGNELSIEWIMKEFMYTKIGGITADPNVHNRADIEKLVDHSIIIWRCWTSYFPAIIGVFGFGSLTATQIKQYRLKHKK